MGKSKKQGNLDLPAGALVHAKIKGRTDELGLIVDYNYGLPENTWYMVYGLDSDKVYFVYPHELTLINIRGGGKEKKR
jgi:hypothetical protein